MPGRTMSMTEVRLRGRTPRLALIAAAASLLVAATARTFGAAPVRQTTTRVAGASSSVAATGLAERFAREYMTFIPGGDAQRRDRLTKLGLADSGAPDDRTGSAASHVEATSIAAATRQGRRVTVTVAVLDGAAWTYLAVPIARTVAGSLFVAGPPAVVGAPHVAVGQLGAVEQEVQDPELSQVARRVVRHYLAADGTDLAADLAPGAAVSLPQTQLRLASVAAVTWVTAGRRVALVAEVRDSAGLRLTLRYELSVVRRSARWLVRTVDVDPTQQENP